ncbi:MAG: ferritin-like domain-containing protein, partial [Xanthomonadales bacterium]|nr:ferritin-like domain-containing protein [Xanthomonadales bacterium]
MPAIFERTAECLGITSPEDKCCAVTELWVAAEAGQCEFDPHTPVTPIGNAGHPAKPELVDPTRVKRRRLGSVQGRAALIHAIAHIEFNAINLALDAVYRFRDMPRQYYLDWLSVAADEARHYRLLSQRLQVLGFEYGDFPAHNGLWEMAQRTADDCLKRMALVPRVLEARGLDVTPGMIERLEDAGDIETVRILGVILEEEVRHVKIGSHWFHDCCDKRGLEPEATFLALLRDHFSGQLRGPFNMPARMQAGFTQ